MTDPFTEAEQAALARRGRRRAIGLDISGIVLAVAGTGALVVAFVLMLGTLVGLLLCGGVGAVAAGVALMRREHSVPAVLMPSMPDGPREHVAETREPYAPARSIADGAPRSPLSGM
jgi:hypothetical protein